MSEFIFQGYIETPGEKHIGVAQVKCWNKVTLRYKVIKTRDGSAFYIAAASYRVKDSESERYISTHLIESQTDKEEIENLIKVQVKKEIQRLEEEKQRKIQESKNPLHPSMQMKVEVEKEEKRNPFYG